MRHALPALGLVSLLLAGCALIRPPAPVELSAEDSGKPVTLSRGQTLTVNLVSNHTTGYRWMWMNPVNPVLTQVGEPSYKPSQATLDGVVGGGGTEVWTFRADKDGSGKLILEYRRPWSMQVPALKTLTYPVTVD